MNQLEKIAELVGCPPKERLLKLSNFGPTMIEGHSELANNEMARLMTKEDELKTDIDDKQAELDQQGARIEQARAAGENEETLTRWERVFNESLGQLGQKKAERDEYVRKQQAHMEGKFRTVFKDASLDAIDVMIALLHLEPHKRVTAEGALSHAYIRQFHDPAAERTAERKVLPSIDDDDKKSTAYYRDQLYRQISDRRNSTKNGFGGGNYSGRDHTDGGASVRSYSDSRREPRG